MAAGGRPVAAAAAINTTNQNNNEGCLSDFSSPYSPSLAGGASVSTDVDRTSSSPSTGFTSYGDDEEEEEEQSDEVDPAPHDRRGKTYIYQRLSGAKSGLSTLREGRDPGTSLGSQGVNNINTSSDGKVPFSTTTARWRSAFSRAAVAAPPSPTKPTSRTINLGGPSVQPLGGFLVTGSDSNTLAGRGASFRQQMKSKGRMEQGVDEDAPAVVAGYGSLGYRRGVRTRRGAGVGGLLEVLQENSKDVQQAPTSSGNLKQRSTPLRLTRSNPNLRSAASFGSGTSGLSRISRDQDGFYRPVRNRTHAHATDAPTFSVAPDYFEDPSSASSHHVLRPTAGAPPVILSKGSLSNQHKGLQGSDDGGDVLSKLLGWSSPPGSPRRPPRKPASNASPGTSHDPAKLDISPSIRIEGPTQTSVEMQDASPGAPESVPYMDRPLEQRTPVTSTFAHTAYDTADRKRTLDHAPAISQVISNSDIDGDETNAPPKSPFGAGVRLSSGPRTLRHKKTFTFRPAFEASETLNEDQTAPSRILGSEDVPRAVRETASNETIRQAKPYGSLSENHAGPVASIESSASEVVSRFAGSEFSLDPRIFDVLHSAAQPCWRLSRSSIASSSGDDLSSRSAEGGHKRNLSTTSISTSASVPPETSHAASKTAHDITVSARSGDDPRFVIWGYRATPAPQHPPESIHSRQDDGKMGSRFSRRRNSSRSGLGDTGPRFPLQEPLASSNVGPSRRILMASTLDRWIAELTSEKDTDMLVDFFLTYRTITTPLNLCKLLITRFEWALHQSESPEELAAKRVVRVRTFIVLRYWLLNFFGDDFVPNKELRVLLTAWLNRMGKDPFLRMSKADLKLIKALKKVVKQFKATYTAIGPESNLAAQGQLHDVAGRRRAGTVSSTASIPLAAAEIIATQGLQRSDRIDEPASTPPRPDRKASTDVNNGRRGSISSAQGVRSSSEEEVDLEIELYGRQGDHDDANEDKPRLPQVIPISPPRSRVHSPKVSRRSPRRNNSSPQILADLPGMHDNNRLSRYFTSTLGSFSKFKRMMRQQRDSSRAVFSSMHTGPHLAADSGFGAQSSEKAYGPSPNRSSVTASNSGLGLSLPLQGDTDDDATEDTPKQRRVSMTRRSQSTEPRDDDSASLRNSQSNHASEKRSSFRPDAGNKTSGGTQLLAPPAELSPAFLRSSDIVQLDDCESSGDESEGEWKPPVRTLRRLPAARDLRTARTVRPDIGRHRMIRHSFDSLASYALDQPFDRDDRIPSFATFNLPQNGANAKADAAIAQGIIPFFVTPADSDDEDETGDVEDALRRLEGQVDAEKRQQNARKVELYLRKCEEVAVSGLVPPLDGLEEDDDDEEPFDDRARSDGPADGSLPPATASSPSIASASAEVQNGHQAQADATGSTGKPSLPDEAPAKLSIAPSAATAHIRRTPSNSRLFGSTRASAFFRPGSRMSHHHPTAGLPYAQPQSWVMAIKTDILAQHFCVIERDLLEKVAWQELVSGKWKERELTGEVTDWNVYLKQRARLNASLQAQAAALDEAGHATKAGDVQAIIQHFNLVCNWVCTEVLLTHQVSDRATLIAKFIRLAFKSYRVYNFQTVTQIVLGLQSPNIERLKRTWKRVPAFEMRLFNQLKYFCSHLRNFRLLRGAAEALLRQWGPPGQEGEAFPPEMSDVPGAIPFFGLFLRDLAIASELPTYLDPSNPQAPAVIESGTQFLSSYTDPHVFSDLPPLPADLPIRPLINVHKLRTIATIVQHVMAFKEMAVCYPYEPEIAVYRRCLSIRSLPSAHLHSLSLEVEP